jgi:hypothetical protein
MSTILKALRRLEKDKAPPGRPLRDQVTREHDAGPAAPRPARRWPFLAGSVVTGVLAGLAVLLLFFRGGPPAPEPAPATAAPAPAAAAPTAPAAPAAAPAPADSAAALREKRRAMRQARLRAAAAPAPAAVEPEVAPPPPGPEPALPEVAVIDRGAPGPRIAQEPPEAAAPPPPAPTPGSARPWGPVDPTAAGAVAPAPVAPAPPAPVAPAPPAPVERPAPVAAVREAAAPAKPKPAAAPPAPKPARAAPAFPPLRVERTTWHPSAERRVATVQVGDEGPREVREGDRVEGMIVLRIEPSAIVFEHAGREVRRKVGAGS